MIDCIKILISDKEEISRLNRNNKLAWQQSLDKLNNHQDGSISSKITKTYKGIVFCFHENYLNIFFKPHYYFNNNLHNANDFTINDCLNVFREFILDFKISNHALYKIVNIEFGINFRYDKYGKNLITFTEYHKKDEFYNDVELPFSKKSSSITKDGKMANHKIIKFYCKGLQFPQYCNIETLRLEVKSKRSKYIKNLNIYNIGDLRFPDPYNEMKKEIISVVNNLLIIDHFANLKVLNKKDQQQLNKYLNTHTWYNSIQKSRNTFSQKKNRYYKLLDKTGKNIQQELKSIIELKLATLFNNRTCAYSTPNTKQQSVHIPQYIKIEYAQNYRQA